jgi:D-tyrosyl-tRNA(Tyr) deacylase
VRTVIQRVSRASVTVEGETVAAIDRGLLILVGVTQEDTQAEAQKLARKAAELRIFPDPARKFNLSLLDVSGQALVVSQFTLVADVRRGRRPSFTEAAPPEVAAPLVEAFAQTLREMGVPTQTGVFGAMMEVELVNDGPVTIMLDCADLEMRRRG